MGRQAGARSRDQIVMGRVASIFTPEELPDVAWMSTFNQPLDGI